MSFKLNWINNNIVITFHDELNSEQLHEADNAIYGDARFDNMKYQIFDFTHVTKINLSHAEVEIISVLDKNATRWNNSVKVASVTSNNYMREMVDIYTKGMRETNWISKTFDTIEQAKKWYE